jgi:hypothetical protein
VREALEEREMTLLLPDLPAEERFEYYLAYGRSLGGMGELAAMDDALTRALLLAAEELADMERIKKVWYWTLYYARHQSSWIFLEKQCLAAAEFGMTVGSASLRQMAAEFCAHAHRGLGREEEARRGAMKILRRLETIGANRERLQEWRDFLAH